MRHSDFTMGLEFWLGPRRMRVTDIGTRVIVAIQANIFDDEQFDPGPPYASMEYVLDEHDQIACTLERPEE